MDDLNGRLELGLRIAVSRRRDRFERFYDSLQHNDPKGKVNALRQDIVLLSLRAESLLSQRLESFHQEFGDKAARLEVLSPLKTLARGYAIATHSSGGVVVTDSGMLTIGEKLTLKLFRGQAKCRVETLETANT
jgi:exodeoxyribonuclease VII large subunit